MSAFKKLAAGFAVSAMMASNGAMAQDVLDVSGKAVSQANSVGSGDEGYDYADYCAPLNFTTSVANEFFGLVGCEGGDNADFWINTPLVEEGFKIPTVEDFNNNDPLAKCLYGSLPGGTAITDEADGMVGTGDFVMGEDVLKDVTRGILYECRSFNMS